MTHRRVGEVANIRGCTIKEIAAIDAFFENGYSQKLAVKTAGYRGSGSHIWQKECVRTEVQRRLQKTEIDRQKAYDKARVKNNVTKERLINEYAKMAFAPLSRGRTLCIDPDTDEEVMVECIEVTKEQHDIGANIPVDARDKRAALDSLAKMEGLFIDHLKISDERTIMDNLMAGRNRVAKLKRITEEAPNALDSKTHSEK